MAGLKIKNETVYVIYRDGQPYQETGRKLVYTSKGAANGVITTDAREEARFRYDDMQRAGGYKIPDWWDIGKDKQQDFIDLVRAEFTVVEYGPKGGAK